MKLFRYLFLIIFLFWSEISFSQVGFYLQVKSGRVVLNSKRVLINNNPILLYEKDIVEVSPDAIVLVRCASHYVELKPNHTFAYDDILNFYLQFFTRTRFKKTRFNT